MTNKIVGVRFHRGGRIYNFDPGMLDLHLGQEVIVETEQGLAFGTVRKLYGPNLLNQHPNPDFKLDLPWQPEDDEPQAADDMAQEADEDSQPEPLEPIEEAAEEVKAEVARPALKKVLRLASEADCEQLKQNRELEKKALIYCRERVAELKLNMALVTAEYHFDRSKMVIFFTSEERLDFRELVYDLASYLHTKVELRQIGVRQETKMLGGLGGCGRELCCAHFLHEFTQVGVKMAKEQSLSLNPTKISGLCGRLMCCLSYEFETYRALCKDFPKVGKKIKISPELEGKVLRHAPLTGQLTVYLNDGRTVTCTLQELYTLEPAQNNSRRGGNRPVLATPPVQPEPVEVIPEPVPAPPEQAAATAPEAPEEKADKPKRRSRRSRGRRKGKGARPAPGAESQS